MSKSLTDHHSCFLPQDKVAKFAAMPPNDVLTATMKSAGDSRLYNWHEKLKGLGVEHDKLETVSLLCPGLRSRG